MLKWSFMKYPKFHIHFLTSACLLISIGACSKPSDTVVATVNSTKITAAELAMRMRMEEMKYDPALLGDKTNFETFRRRTLSHLIEEGILLEEAARLGIKPSEENLKKMDEMHRSLLGDGPDEIEKPFRTRDLDPEDWRKAQQRRLIINELIQKEVVDKIPISDRQIAKYYQKHIQQFRRPTQFHARQIVVDTRELADKILARLREGDDFATLAKKHSLSPDSERGGDLGYFDATSYPKAFAEVCQQLKIGEISGVVATDYGYQIFHLLDRRQARQRPLEEVAPLIRKILQEERGEEALARKFEEWKKNSIIVVKEDALEGVKLEDNK